MKTPRQPHHLLVTLYVADTVCLVEEVRTAGAVRRLVDDWRSEEPEADIRVTPVFDDDGDESTGREVKADRWLRRAEAAR